MAEPSFARIKKGDNNYPKRSFDGQEDQSYGFSPAFKLQTGNTRGTQTVGFGGAKIDGANNRISLTADTTKITIGDTSETDDVVGFVLTDTVTNKKLVSIGRDAGASDEVTGLTAYDSDGTRRLLGGTYPDGTVKIKLSQRGHDVATATDNQLIWSSDFNMFKIVSTGTFTVPALDAAGGASDTSTTVYDTGYATTTPLAYNAYVSNDSGGYIQLPQVSINYSGNFQMYRTVAVELSGGTAQLRVYSQNFTGFPTDAKTVKYYLFKESIV